MMTPKTMKSVRLRLNTRFRALWSFLPSSIAKYRLQADDNMPLRNEKLTNSMKWDSKIGGGNKKLKFIGNTGTISFIPTLIGSSSK